MKYCRNKDYGMPGTPERGCITGALPPALWKGGNGGTSALT